MQIHEVKYRESISVTYNITKTRNSWTLTVTGWAGYRAAYTPLFREQLQPMAGSLSRWETASHFVNWIMRSIYLSILFKIIALFNWEFVTSMWLNSLSPLALYLLLYFIRYYLLFFNVFTKLMGVTLFNKIVEVSSVGFCESWSVYNEAIFFWEEKQVMNVEIPGK